MKSTPQPPPPGAAAVMPENATNTARPLRAMVPSLGADGLALVMSIGAATEHESAQGAAFDGAQR
jgi:hypothetical protein